MKAMETKTEEKVLKAPFTIGTCPTRFAKDHPKHFVTGHYFQQKKRSLIYKMLFFGIGILYLALDCILYLYPIHFALSFPFLNISGIKPALLFLCTFAATTATILGIFTNNPAKETAKSLATHAKNKIAHAICSTHIPLIDALFNMDKRRMRSEAKRQYQRSIKSIDELKTNTQTLLEHITHSGEISSIERQEIALQALLDLQKALTQLVERFCRSS